jgi:glycogen synthase
LEGMVAHVPVVVSECGGLGEIVNHGIDGMKAYTGNSNSLADSVLEILYNPDKANEMKNRAFEKVKTMYNWDIISEQTLDVYKEVLSESEKSDWKIPEIKF